MRDVSKILSDAEVTKLKALIAQAPNLATGPDEFQDYPKMMFHPDWLEVWKVMARHPDPLLRKEAQEKLRIVQVIVHNLEDEEEYLADGWVNDPNQIIIDKEGRDPRVPTGRESRRAKADEKRDRERELAEIRRRYAELTGRRLADEPTQAEPAMVAAVQSEPEPEPRPVHKRTAPAQVSKRERVKQAAAKASQRTQPHA